jgi:3-methyladenine DNA glycosylase AlkD
MARYGIPSEGAFGVTFGELRAYAKGIPKGPGLARALWSTGRYEARLLAALVDDPRKVTPSQMDRWAAEFDSWAVCDTVCFHLFDRTPHAWSRVHAWAGVSPTFKKRAAFAVLWGLTVHDREASDDRFLETFPLIERGALDEREMVKKGVDMALRAVGKRSPGLRRAAIELAAKLEASPEGSRAWIGRSVLRELRGKPATRSRRRAPSR